MDTKLITNSLLKEKYYSENKVFKNVYWDSFECDILVIKNSLYTIEYEIKISRSDFKNDKKKFDPYRNKTKSESIISGDRTNYFYYVVPDGLITTDEVPEYAGLIYVKKSGKYISFENIKKAPKIHKQKISPDRYLNFLEKIYHHYMRILKY